MGSHRKQSCTVVWPQGVRVQQLVKVTVLLWSLLCCGGQDIVGPQEQIRGEARAINTHIKIHKDLVDTYVSRITGLGSLHLPSLHLPSFHLPSFHLPSLHLPTYPHLTYPHYTYLPTLISPTLISSGVAKLGHTGAHALATRGCAPPVQALLLKIIGAECTVINCELSA